MFRVVEKHNPAENGEAIDWSIGLLPAWHMEDISVMSSSLCKYNVFTVGRFNAMVKHFMELVFIYFKTLSKKCTSSAESCEHSYVLTCLRQHALFPVPSSGLAAMVNDEYLPSSIIRHLLFQFDQVHVSIHIVFSLLLTGGSLSITC